MKHPFRLLTFTGLLLALSVALVAAGPLKVQLGYCYLFDEAMNVVPAVTRYDSKVYLDGTTFESGKASCQASGVDNTTGSTLVFTGASTGALCQIVQNSTDAWVTLNWEETLDANGKAKLTCRCEGSTTDPFFEPTKCYGPVPVVPAP